MRQQKCQRTMSGMSPSSGLGIASSSRIVVSSAVRLIAGPQLPFGGIFSVSKQMRPSVSMLGWYTGVIKRARGGSNGYLHKRKHQATLHYRAAHVFEQACALLAMASRNKAARHLSEEKHSCLPFGEHDFQTKLPAFKRRSRRTSYTFINKKSHRLKKGMQRQALTCIDGVWFVCPRPRAHTCKYDQAQNTPWFHTYINTHSMQSSSVTQKRF